MKNMDNPVHYRQYILNMLIVTAGSWDDTGCQDKELESKFEALLGKLSPDRKRALDILYKHITQEVAV